MQESASPDAWQWVSVEQASALTRLSPATIRRRIRDAQTVTLPGGETLVLQAERIERPQGSTFQVRLPASLGAPPADASPDESADASPPTPTPTSDDLQKLLSNLGQQWLEPVLAELRGAHERELASAEHIGILKARLEVALQAHGETAGERDQANTRAEALAAELAELQTELQGLRLAREIANNVEAGRTQDDWARLDAPTQEPGRRWWQRLVDWI